MFKRFSLRKSSIRSLIKHRQWDEILHLLSDDSQQKELHHVAKKNDTTGKTILHELCCMHPPLTIVEKVIQQCPALVRQVDNFGRTALHYAAEWGASPKVLELLLRENKDAALQRDFEGKTPLHLTFGGYSDGWYDTGNEAGDILTGLNKPIIILLCQASPEAINIEDEDGMNPIECAIIKKMDISIIKIMQKHSMTIWRQDNEVETLCEAKKRAINYRRVLCCFNRNH